MGITRAKRRLYVTRAAVRAQWGQANDMMPSQFLDEIPDELIDWKRREAGVERMRASWGDDDEFGGWDDDDDFGSTSFGESMYGSSTYGSSSYGSGSRGSHSTYGSSHGSHSSYGSGRSSYGSGSRRFSGGLHSGSSSYGSYGSSRSSYGSGKPSGKSGKVTTRRAKPKDLTKSAPASSLDGNNGLSISDFQIGDRITHDHYGLGKVIETQDKGANSVITVDFGTDGVKRLLLRVAPIEKL